MSYLHQEGFYAEDFEATTLKSAILFLDPGAIPIIITPNNFNNP